MFYEPKDGSGLPHNPLNAIVVPRPIGWISTLSAEGVPNLAPYSFFNAVAYTPPQVMFSATSNHQFGGLKDAVADAQATGEFVVNVATWELREQMNASAVPAPARGRRVRIRRAHQGGEQAGELSPRGREPGAPGVPLHQPRWRCYRTTPTIRTPSSSAKS